MTDEAKPPKKQPAGSSKRPRRPANAGGKPGAKKPAAGRTAAKKPAAGTSSVPVSSTRKVAAKTTAASKAAATEPAPPDAAVTQPLPADEARAATTALLADAATATLPADSAAPTTSGSDQPTQVDPGPDESATHVAGGAAPPFAPVPQAVDPSGGGDRGVTVWLIVVLALAAALAIVLVWAYVLRDTGEQFVGTWAPADGGGGGLVVSLRDGDFTVAVFDTDLEPSGTYPAVRDGDDLTFRFTDTQSGRGLMKARLTHVDERDVLVMRLTWAGTQGASQEYMRVDALRAETPPPAPAPAVTTMPTASPSASPSGSPVPLPSPTASDTTQSDQQVVDGIVAIQVGVLNWSMAHGDMFPAPVDVAQDGAVGELVSPWPRNPFSGQPMATGTEPGDYTYEQLNGGRGYKLVGHLAGGLTFTVP